MSTITIPVIFTEDRKDIPKLSYYASWPDAMINPQWLELLMSRTYFYGPKDVRAIDIRRYFSQNWTILSQMVSEKL